MNIFSSQNIKIFLPPERNSLNDATQYYIELIEKAIEKAEDEKDIEWGMELVEFRLLSGALEKNKSQTPLVYEHYKKY